MGALQLVVPGPTATAGTLGAETFQGGGINNCEPDILTHIVRAEAHLQLGQYKEAACSCHEALLMDHDNVFALTVQAEVNLRLGKCSNALEDCDAAIMCEPANVAAYVIRCETNLMLNRCKEAIMDCDWAL